MLLSSFELLFEPITPIKIENSSQMINQHPLINPGPAVPDPVVVQAYFVSISNVGANPVALTLTFTSILSLENTFTLFDKTNIFKKDSTRHLHGLTPPKFNIGSIELMPLNPGETGLFLLQPDIFALLPTLGNPLNITKSVFAARGYVDVSAPEGTDTQCLITPETRGTFLTQASPSEPISVVAQEAYVLPTPDSNLFTFV